MASDDAHPLTTTNVAESDAIDRLEDYLLSRRSFLAGLGVGGAGAALGLTREDAGFQSLASLAGGAAFPVDTRYYLLAIDGAGGGLVVTADFEFVDGNGELFVNLDSVEVRHDLQLALHEAVAAATELAGESFEGTAIHVTFRTASSDVVVLRGKSWEAGLVVALVAGLRGITLDRKTLVTGVVNNEGRLLPVGGVETKARVARDFGASELVVPDGQATEFDVPDLRLVSGETISDAIGRVLGRPPAGGRPRLGRPSVIAGRKNGG